MPEDLAVREQIQRMSLPGAAQPLFAPPVNPAVEAFLSANTVEGHAAARLRALPFEQQQIIISHSLAGARDPTAVLIGRVRKVAGWVPAEQFPGRNIFATPLTHAATQGAQAPPMITKEQMEKKTQAAAAEVEQTLFNKEAIRTYKEKQATYSNAIAQPSSITASMDSNAGAEAMSKGGRGGQGQIKFNMRGNENTEEYQQDNREPREQMRSAIGDLSAKLLNKDGDDQGLVDIGENTVERGPAVVAKKDLLRPFASKKKALVTSPELATGTPTDIHPILAGANAKTSRHDDEYAQDLLYQATDDRAPPRPPLMEPPPRPGKTQQEEDDEDMKEFEVFCQEFESLVAVEKGNEQMKKDCIPSGISAPFNCVAGSQFSESL